MALTAEECRIAAERARGYPAYRGGTFIAKPREDGQNIKLPDSCIFDLCYPNATATAKHLAIHPEDVAYGCPAVAVAAARGALGKDDLNKAFRDVHMACGLQNDTYCKILGNDPIAIAECLEKKADFLKAKELKDDTDG